MAIRNRAALALFFAASGLAAGAASAAPLTTINGLTFDLGQFAGAAVTTNVGSNDLNGTTFDNPNGIDGFTLGELASGQFGGDFGDRISLGEVNGEQDFLTLTYGAPVLIGDGQASLFVVYESSGRTFLDEEGTNFEISFNGGAFIAANASASVTATGGVLGAANSGESAEHNQVIFDLLHSDFGFSVGQTISTVTIRNLVVLGSSADDPDFTFAGRAGVVSAVPLPAAAPMLLGGVALFGLLRRRRRA